MKKKNDSFYCVILIFFLFPFVGKTQIVELKYGDQKYMTEVKYAQTEFFNPDIEFGHKWKLKDSLPDGIYVVTIKKHLFSKKRYHCISYYFNGVKNGTTIWYNAGKHGLIYTECIANYKDGLLNGKLHFWYSPLDECEEGDTLSGIYRTANFVDGYEDGISILYLGNMRYEIYYKKNLPLKWYLYRGSSEIVIEEGSGSPFYSAKSNI